MKLLTMGTLSTRKFLATLPHGTRILNAGCGAVDLRAQGYNAFSVDVRARPHVDYVHDLNAPLPSFIGSFDAVVCVAVLQYCPDPVATLVNLRRVLQPGGRLYIEVPWIQQYCEDTPDRYRFSDVGLRGVLEAAGLELLEIAPGIRPGSALAWLAFDVADHATRSRLVNVGLRMLVAASTWPLRFVRTVEPRRMAGSFNAIAKRP